MPVRNLLIFLRGAQHSFVLALAVDDALRRLLGSNEHRPHDEAGLPHELRQAVAVRRQVVDRPGRNTAFLSDAP